MLMFELHQRKKIPEKKSNGINKLMYVLHQRTDLPEKEKKQHTGLKDHLSSAFRLIDTELTRYPNMVSHARNIQ